MHPAPDPRFKKRLPCRLEASDGARTGMVLNVSRGGLFVQTSSPANPGDAVRIDLAVDPTQPLAVDACVVWRRVVGAQLRAVQTGGFGARIRYAPDAWFGFLAGLAGSEVAAPPAEPAGRAALYRVRLRLAGSPRTRIVVVEGADADAARARARTVAGAQWVVLDLIPDPRET